MPIKQLPPSRPSSDVDVLEPLELPLRGFQTNDETPTSAPTSLPTPSGEQLQHVQVLPVQQWLLPSDTEHVVEAPGAPLMRDYDSFTEGTAKGSFDSIPIASTDQYGEPLVVLDQESVGTLPTDIPSRSTIEKWRDVVFQSIDPLTPHLIPSAVEIGYDDDGINVVTPTKRPRSITSDDGVRRTRARPHSLMIVSTLAHFNQCSVVSGDVAAPSVHQPDIPTRVRSQSAPPTNRDAPP